MTNEQLAIRIKEGDKDLIPQLWDNVSKLLKSLCNKLHITSIEKCTKAGVTIDDIFQESYFAMLDAVEYYKPED